MNTLEQLSIKARLLTAKANVAKMNSCHNDSDGRFCSSGGSGGSALSPKVGLGRYSYERKALEAVANNPHLDKLFDLDKGLNYASNTSVWQSRHIGDRDKAIKATQKLKDKATTLGFAPTKTPGRMKHPDGTRVDIQLRKTSVSVGGKVGSGVQITLLAPPKKKAP